MPYRRTSDIVRKQTARRLKILEAARLAAAEGGMAAVQIAPVAARAGIATGTVYRYFPCKTELVAALVAVISEEELAALRNAARTAPGPVSALAASIATFAVRALRHRRLAFAVLSEPADADIVQARAAYRQALADEWQSRIAAAMRAGHLPQQDIVLSSSALVGALLEGLLGPLAPDSGESPARNRETVQLLTLLALRALGVNDARARGLVVQVALPAIGENV
jgi:AcrR family transcriptional regulator